MATATAYWVSADMRRPYYVYIGLQDNGSWGGPSATRSANGILNSDWFGIGGGDGFQTAVDPTDYNIVYTESQDGNTNRYDLRNGRVQSIRPRPAGRAAADAAVRRRRWPRRRAPNVLNSAPGDQYRFNWNTPFQLSPHNPSIVWLGGNRLFKSLNRGDTWTASADLTKQIDRNTVSVMGVPGNRTMLSKNDGVVAYSTIISLSESPVVPGVVWVGTDDGNVQVSRDGGPDVHRSRQEHARAARESSLLDLAHRRVALRRRHRLRLGRRPSLRRPEALPVRDARLRTDVGEHQRQPAAVRLHPGGA